MILLALRGVSRDEHPYGGLKNCSKTTYIPRIISVMRKYLPALSNVLSLLSSHRSGLGNRKPCGGGPLGVADRGEDVENATVGVVLEARTAAMGVENGRARTNAVRDLAEAMLRL